MSNISRLELVPHHRLGGGGKTERWSWDFAIDGKSLSSVIAGDVIGVLGWGPSEWQSTVLDRLLGKAPPDFPSDRVALYVCPECADLGCGGITAALKRESDSVEWSDFAFERDYESADERELLPIGPYRFDRGAYGRLLREGIAVTPSLGTPIHAAG